MNNISCGDLFYITEKLNEIIALTENPHWTTDRKYKIAETATKLQAFVREKNEIEYYYWRVLMIPAAQRTEKVQNFINEFKRYRKREISVAELTFHYAQAKLENV